MPIRISIKINPSKQKSQSTRETHVYGLKLTIFHPIAGEIVCGAVANNCKAVAFGVPELGVIAAKYLWAEPVANV